ncbi:MAG: flagellar brake domain-containing protein [Lachnospiraceae bacterium]|nr:flagellar brake domain-containing protein [Lachnospiraceae bacterium]
MAVSIGNKIELVKLEQVIRNDPEKKVYISKVYDVMPNRMLQIAMPILEGKIVPLEVGGKFSACFYTGKGLLAANCTVEKRYKSGNLFYLEIKLLAEPTKVQRREFYRYSIKLDCQVRPISEKEFETGIPEDTSVPEVNLPSNPARMLDLSGGGIRLAQKAALKKNEHVKVIFVLPFPEGPQRFILIARVLSNTLMEGKGEVYEQRMEFLRVKSEERDSIVRFIFERERADRAKESGINR